MPIDVVRNSLAAAFDRLNSKSNLAWLDRAVVNFSIAGFLVHLALVFVARTLTNPPWFIAEAGRNYLAAIYTPFSFILFYEVLMLIAALPQSTTQSIAKQYEIVSLIFIRRFFKDIAHLDETDKLKNLTSDVVPVFLDVGAGLVMFLLVTVFVSVGRRRESPDTQPHESLDLKRFIARKKGIALGLTVLLISLAAYNLYKFVFSNSSIDTNSFYYADVFTVMIFTDVLIVILSLVVSDRYELVFRNAAFVISTILIRFSLTAGQPYGAVLALSGMISGIFTLLVYNYHCRVRR